MSGERRAHQKRSLPDYEYRAMRDELAATYEEEKMGKVYIIRQAFTPNDSDYELEEIYGVSGPEFYSTEEYARTALTMIAALYDIELDGERSFDVPSGSSPGYRDEYFYIDELNEAE